MNTNKNAEQNAQAVDALAGYDISIGVLDELTCKELENEKQMVAYDLLSTLGEAGLLDVAVALGVLKKVSPVTKSWTKDDVVESHLEMNDILKGTNNGK